MKASQIDQGKKARMQSTLNTSQRLTREMLPQSPALKVSVDVPGKVKPGTIETGLCMADQAGIQHARGALSMKWEPIADLEWDQPYHLDVKQRVPMNPNRDAVDSGYLTKVHRAALPVLVHEMDAAKALSDWVGSAAAGAR